MAKKMVGRVILAGAVALILVVAGFLFWRWSFPTVPQVGGWESHPDVLSLRIVEEDTDVWYDFEGGDALDNLVSLLKTTRLGRREQTDQVPVGCRLLLGTREADGTISWYHDMEFDKTGFVWTDGWRYSVPQEAETTILSQLKAMTENMEGRS